MSAIRGGVSPTASSRRQGGAADDPPQPRPREQEHGGARDVGEHVRRELVDECGDQGRQGCEPDDPGHPPHAEPCGDEQRADPEAMGDPVRHTERLEHPEPRTGRPEVGDVLVGNPAGELPGIHRGRRVGEEASGVEVDVELRVARHPTRGGGERRHVGQQTEHDDRDPRGVASDPGHGDVDHRARGRMPDMRLTTWRAPCLAVRRWCDASVSSDCARCSMNQS